MFRFTNALRRHDAADAVVIGGGPSGIAVVGNLLSHLPQKHRQIWADPVFRAGRVNACYREVPSNTKVDLFSKFATAVEPFQRIVAHTEAPNAFTSLGELPQDQGCTLSHAADLCLMLSDGLDKNFSQVQKHHGRITTACLDKRAKSWTVETDSQESFETTRLILCTGSSPIAESSQISQLTGPHITKVNLDTALTPSILSKFISQTEPSSVAVVGASHSAILVLMNLFNLATTTHPHLRIKWFTRHKKLRYAKPMDGWILYDNTGLKGQAAEWARENLEEETFRNSPASHIIAKIWTGAGDNESKKYEQVLPSCTHIVQAIGYMRDPLPQIMCIDHPNAAPEPLSIEHDGITGRFFALASTQSRHYIPGLFGAGIAFPERVTDPVGNVESAVGFWKFMNFCKRVVPQWVKEPSM